MEKFWQYSDESQRIYERIFYKVAAVLNQVRSYGDTIEDKKVIEKILRNLPPSLDHIVVVIEESKDLSKLSFYELMASLEIHEHRRNKLSNKEVEQAFQSKLVVSIKKGAEPKKEK